MNNDENAYFTFKGYQLNNDSNLTSSMEDYLEMIIRLKEKQPFVRINELANNLNVRPSSASKMVTKLSQEGFLEYQKYGIITLTELGKQWGEYFIYRHQVLNNFLCLLNNSHNELEQVEKIEHFLNKKTIDNLALLTKELHNLQQKQQYGNKSITILSSYFLSNKISEFMLLFFR